MYYKRKIGINGEDIASAYLKELGYQIIERNFSCRQGEIDIIAKNKNEFIFVEVKTRTSKKIGNPAESVDNYKKKHLLNAVKFYIYLKRLYCYFIRIDVIEVYINKDKIDINHIKKAIE